ncbi:MAG: hypothetical protein WCK93_06540 [Nitrosomonadales bacterium]|jgi:hypothetical protein|nr:hypothetical protein [Gallionella sp.]OGS67076.1 MAG: hypothetical protein A2Z87_02450 [Gallionellales bacterium GWA2_54_124]OGT18133.1 MAG: hypothetical protein A2522_09745 [Gallionellales bacterium RIFOXYD12_FULL_53_10]OGT27397.1 MAG: hypothetical protein A3K00_04940 [Gallionellales bacterium RIFOXYD2_FULL_52_7]HCI51854.1 hypothetical protein [Gallionella sp.]
MSNAAYMPKDDNSKADLLEHMAVTLPKYTVPLNISDGDMVQLKADAVGFRYVLKRHQMAESHRHNWTACKDQIRDGGTGSNDWPVSTPEDAEIPPPLTPGVIPRLSKLIAAIKANKNYTEAIGQDLRLIGARHVIVSDNWKPALSAKNKGGHAVISWTKGDAHALEIWADRGDGKGFVFFTISTTASVTDNSPLPDSISVWQYKAIYRLSDEQVGLWSDVLSVTVGNL